MLTRRGLFSKALQVAASIVAAPIVATAASPNVPAAVATGGRKLEGDIYAELAKTWGCTRQAAKARFWPMMYGRPWFEMSNEPYHEGNRIHDSVFTPIRNRMAYEYRGSLDLSQERNEEIRVRVKELADRFRIEVDAKMFTAHLDRASSAVSAYDEVRKLREIGFDRELTKISLQFAERDARRTWEAFYRPDILTKEAAAQESVRHLRYLTTAAVE
jgi:hypothetical protein